MAESKIKIEETSIPESSLLRGIPYDYADCFATCLPEGSEEVDPLKAIKLIFRSTPGWVTGLLKLRNAIVKPFGLKTGESKEGIGQVIDNFSGEIGSKIALFKVVDRNQEEIVFGEKDRHLDFHLGIHTQSANRITLITLVSFNNRFGRMYFFVIKPFHKIITKAILRNMVKKLSAGTDPA